MGNKNSCCFYSSPQLGRKDLSGEGDRGLQEHLPEGEISINNLQHISEREPEDWDSDPSLHPCAGTIFMERSKQAIESKYYKYFVLFLSFDRFFNVYTIYIFF
jgi:hypothetical protein